MPVAFYMDENIDSKITEGLRKREVDVLTVQEDGFVSRSDNDILDRAYQLNRIAITFDRHFSVEVNRRLKNNIPFYGVIYITKKVSTRKLLDDLELIANVTDYSYFRGKRIEYLPYILKNEK